MTQSEWKDIFGDNLISILRQKGISQARLSRDSGVSTGMISDYINKRSVPGLFAAINIAYALDMSIDELVDFEEIIRRRQPRTPPRERTRA
jgi:transcriptional regulator with XRE-family HTH domain